MSTPGWRERAGRRFARITTDAVVSHPGLWRVFRRPLRGQFDRLAPVWDGRRGPEALEPLERALDHVSAAHRVLDVGTGTGKGARLVASRYPEAEVTGVDLAPGMIAEARALLPADLGSRVHFQVADASALPFPDEAFDLVILLNMIPFFDELGRITMPGASMVFTSTSGPTTPIYVSPAILRDRLAQLGFTEFHELSAGEGTAMVARKPDS